MAQSCLGGEPLGAGAEGTWVGLALVVNHGQMAAQSLLTDKGVPHHTYGTVERLLLGGGDSGGHHRHLLLVGLVMLLVNDEWVWWVMWGRVVVSYQHRHILSCE